MAKTFIEYTLGTEDRGKTWHIFQYVDEDCTSIATLECQQEPAEEVVDALRHVLETGHCWDVSQSYERDDDQFKLLPSPGQYKWQICRTSGAAYVGMECLRGTAIEIVWALNSKNRGGKRKRFKTARASRKKRSQKDEALFLLGVFYTVCESRIDPSHPCNSSTPDWAALSFMLRKFLTDAGGNLECPMPLQKLD